MFALAESPGRLASIASTITESLSQAALQPTGCTIKPVQDGCIAECMFSLINAPFNRHQLVFLLNSMFFSDINVMNVYGRNDYFVVRLVVDLALVAEA